MLQALLNVFRIAELRTKILFTLGMLAVFRIGHWVPLPGVNQDALTKLFEQQTSDEGSAGGRVINFISVFSGGASAGLAKALRQLRLETTLCRLSRRMRILRSRNPRRRLPMRPGVRQLWKTQGNVRQQRMRQSELLLRRKKPGRSKQRHQRRAKRDRLPAKLRQAICSQWISTLKQISPRGY